MAETIPIQCPNCSKALNVPATMAGKKIRCKQCESVLVVPAAPPKPAPAPEKPKSPFADDDDDGPASYTAQKDDLDIPRCPFCTRELDPPDTKICLNCGYDLVQRRRHGSKKVHAATGGDYLRHHALTIVCSLLIIAVVVLLVLAFRNMAVWFADIGFENDQEDPITKKKGWIVPPGACLTPLTVISLGVIFKLGSFVFKRLFKDFKPPEIVKKDEE